MQIREPWHATCLPTFPPSGSCSLPGLPTSAANTDLGLNLSLTSSSEPDSLRPERAGGSLWSPTPSPLLHPALLQGPLQLSGHKSHVALGKPVPHPLTPPPGGRKSHQVGKGPISCPVTGGSAPESADLTAHSLSSCIQTSQRQLCAHTVCCLTKSTLLISQKGQLRLSPRVPWSPRGGGGTSPKPLVSSGVAAVLG